MLPSPPHTNPVPGARCAWRALQTAGTSRPIIKKRAALCLLRLLRKTPADAPLLVSADNFSPTIGALLEERDLGLLLCAATLLQGIVARTGPGEPAHRRLAGGLGWGGVGGREGGRL